MERIQQALAMARASRSEASRPEATRSEAIGTREAPAPVEHPAPLADRAEPAPAEPSKEEVAARWHALREVHPSTAALTRGHVVTATGEKEAARFDVMRTKLLHMMRVHGWTRIAITSPGPSCGKTTLSANLAYSLSRQTELRVTLADADLRRPSIARLLGLKKNQGFPDLIEGRASLEDVALRVRPNLAVLLSPGPRRNPAELFQSPSCAEALKALEGALRPSVMLFDLPPTLVGDDMLAFAEHVDAAIIVAAAGQTTISEIDSCERELAARTNVVGVVLNRCRYLGQDYGYGEYA